MLKKNKLGLALAGLVATTMAFGADAATPAPGKAELRTLPASGAGGDRLIVKYRTGATAARSVTGKLATVNSAAARALTPSARAGAAIAVAPTSRHVRGIASGADVIGLSRKLSRTELDNLVGQLKADPSVEYAEIDERMHPLHTPNDPFYATYQWHFNNAAGGIRMPEAWDQATGEGVVVAVLDTGILPNHVDIGANVLEGYDFITDTFVSRRTTTDRVPGGIDLGDWNDDATECDVADSSWHGTHVAGTVAQVTDNAVGVAGVAYNARVLPVRVLGRCGGYVSDIADAIVWASGGTVDGVPANENPAEVINMSLGGYGSCGATYQNAIDAAVANGTVVVVAAGNSGDNASYYRPASCDNVVTVGASRITGGKAFYSNYGALVDIAAPGGGGYEDPGNSGWNGYVVQGGSMAATSDDPAEYGYVGMIGTSMASPHVAGVAALVQSALAGAERAPLTPAQMETLLKQTARAFPVSIPSGTPIGVGIVDANAALTKALEVPCEVDCGPVAVPLTNKVEVTNLSNSDGEGVYSFEATAGAVLTFLTMKGTGDVSLYASYGEVPSETDYDAKSTRAGNTETVRFTAPSAGTYYLRLSGVYAGVTLVARQ